MRGTHIFNDICNRYNRVYFSVFLGINVILNIFKMRSWTTIIALAVIFAFAIEFRPLDHFMTSYFIDQGVNTTDTQVPKWTNIV